VLARYGGNFRGYKARFAEAAGAAALIIYTDPADGGSSKGKVWPEGGWANDTCVQRGSVVTGDQPGDPRTPSVPSVPGGPGLDEAAMDLPKIPVQPIGYAAAAEILRRMEGKEVPKDSGWVGGLPFPYRLEGGAALQVRVKVVQDRAVRRTANVVATLRGAVHPEELVIVGCHHDAWCFGAADPLAGTIALMESARSFAEAARRGQRPDRSIVFAAWGAEEYGIFGSTEHVEAHRARLLRDAVGYINLDMAAMGPNFGGSCSPSLRDALLGAAVRVPQARGAADETVYDRLSQGGKREPQFGDIGGGSDHVGFNCHAGVPCASLGGNGAEGTSYHSNYDTIAWYRATVGSDYAPALMVTRMTNALACAMAESPVVPLAAARHGIESRRLLLQLRERARDAAAAAAIDALAARALQLAERGGQLDASVATVVAALPQQSPVAPQVVAACARVDRALMALDRAWLDGRGLKDRPWYRSMLAATDRNNGYAATMLPLLAEALQDGPPEAVLAAADRYREAFDRLDTAVAAAQEAVRALETSGSGTAQAASGGS
jgi:N-acetylated-alpha-linked acidic dipeptidase